MCQAQKSVGNDHQSGDSSSGSNGLSAQNTEKTSSADIDGFRSYQIYQ
jgi:hypothetical protein